MEQGGFLDVLKRGWIPLAGFAILLGLVFQMQMQMRAEAAAVRTVFALIAIGIGAKAPGAAGGVAPPGAGPIRKAAPTVLQALREKAA